jgi:hypothetical protein
MDEIDTTVAATTRINTAAVKAIYTSELASNALRDQLAAIGASGALRRATLFVASQAFRVDLEAPDNAARLSAVRRGANPIWALDHQARAYRALEQLAAVDEPADTTETAGANTPFGPTLIVERRWRDGRLRIELLMRESHAALRGWWELGLAGLLPRRYHERLPVALELFLGRDEKPAARLVLRSLERVTMPVTDFQPPADYALRQIEPGRHRGRAPTAPNPTPQRGLAHESAIAALLGAFDDEIVKLQLRDEIPERVRTAINDFSERLDDISGDGLVIDLGPVAIALMPPTANTPPGRADSLAYRLFLRALFWHWGSQLKRIFENNALRQPFLDVIDALDDADPGAPFIDPAPGTSMADRDRFRRMRDVVVAGGTNSPYLPALRSIRASDLPPADQIDVLTTESWDSGAQKQAAEAWFRAEFRTLSLQPSGGLTGEHGKQRGWVENKFISEHLARLIDLELSVGSTTLDVARLRVLNPISLVDETDARFQLIDALDEVPSPGGRKRSGIATSMRLNLLELNGSLTTIPTTNSPLVVALALLMPDQFLKLWNYVEAKIELRGLTADVLVFFEQDRLSPAGPRLRLWVGNVAAESLEVSGFAFSPDGFFAALVNTMLNEFADHLTPAVLQQIRDSTLKTLRSLANAFGRALLLEPGPPVAPSDIALDIQRRLARGEVLREDIRLQRILNLDTEDVLGRLSGDIDAAAHARDEAIALRDALWTAHANLANSIPVDLPPTGFDPRSMTPPLVTRFKTRELTSEEIAALQASFDAWAAQVPIVPQREAALATARALLTAFLEGWPEGQTACEGVPDRFGYRLGLGLCRSGAGTNGRALIYPSGPRSSQRGDLTLLLSARAFNEMTAGTYFVYRGPPRLVPNGDPAVLEQLPAVDWWRDAPEPERLQPKPSDLRDEPPSLPPGPTPGNIPDWRAYYEVLEAGGRGATLVPVSDPAPDEHVAEILVSVNLRVIVTTYEAVQMERCGPDLTRLAAEPDGPAGRLGRFRPAPGTGDPRPDQPSDRPPLITEAEIGFRRVEDGAVQPVLTARALEATRLRYGLADGGSDIDPARLLFSSFGGGVFTPGDSHCSVITAWDVKGREDWLKARIELRFPVFLGLLNFGPGQAPRPPAGRRLGARVDLPFLTYRFDSEPIATSALALEASGPLAGLAEGENRPWLEALLANHALALVRNSADVHRLRPDRLNPDNPLFYVYGVGSRLLVFSPEDFRPYVLLGMHPTHWSGANPPERGDRSPPFLAFNTFGAEGQALNLAIDLFLTESLLDKLRM